MEEQCTDWHGGLGFRNVRLVKSEENSLGIGSYGAVYRAHCDQLVCAAKILHPILFQTRDPGAHRIVERFQREIEFLSGLRHPNIIQYLGSCPDPETRLPVLFMELMDESLTSFLERPEDPPSLPLHIQADIAHDVAQALSHLHHHQVLHRDLSSNNVLLIGSRRAKVTDFGMAKLLGSDPRLTPTYCPGTNVYMSPEALADPPTYTSKLDIFSYGVLIVQLITRKFPNPGPRTYYVQVNNPQIPSGRIHLEVPELERRKEHLDLISPTHPLLVIARDCLKDKEGQRPTAEQLCSHLISLKESGDTIAGDLVYCFDVVSYCKVLAYNWRTEQWKVLPDCPKEFFSIAAVNGQLVAIGGERYGTATSTLYSLSPDPLNASKQKWIERFPRMTYCRNVPAVVTIETSLIVAGGWFQEKDKAPVEVMDTQTLQWSTVASLPHPLWQATSAICGDKLYLGGGFGHKGSNKSVFVCDIKDLQPQSQQTPSLLSRLGISKAPTVWKEIASLTLVLSSLIGFHDCLLAVGGSATYKGANATSVVMQYDVITDSWNVISQMKVKRNYSLVAVLPNNTLMVCGGDTPDGTTASVEFASA